MPAPIPKLEWGPKKLRVWANEVLVPWCLSGRPLRSITCEIDERPTGTIIKPKASRGGSGGAEAGTHPYRVTPAGKEAPTEEVPDPPSRLIVELDSWLAKNLKADGKQTVTGLGTAFDFVPDAEGAFFVWLEATITAGAVTAVEVKYGDAPWEDYPVPLQYDTPPDPADAVQVYAYQLLAYTEAASEANAAYTARETVGYGEGDTAQIVQCVTTHLLLCEACYEGATVLLFFPHHAPGPTYTPPA